MKNAIVLRKHPNGHYRVPSMTGEADIHGHPDSERRKAIAALYAGMASEAQSIAAQIEKGDLDIVLEDNDT